jgi:predicted small secreted protein
MKRYLLLVVAMAYAAFLLWGCASVHRATQDLEERMSARWEGSYEAVDEGLDSLSIEAKYFAR